MNPENGYIAFIINPKSGASSIKQLVSGLLEYLQFRKFDVRVDYTKSLEHAQQLAKEAGNDDQCQLIIASGGDGTIRDIANELIGTNKPLLPVPSGTENLLSSELGYDEKLTTLIKAFEQKHIVDYDLCKIDHHMFTSIAGFGFDGEVVDRVNNQRKGNIDQSVYFWPLWRTFWTHKFPTFKVEVDSEKIYEGPGMVFVGNSSRYAMGLHILKNANYSDGLLDVCIYRCKNRVTLLKDAFLTVTKSHTKLGSVIYKQGVCVKITPVKGKMYSQIDGDPGPELPIEIRVIPAAIKMVVPKGAKPAGLRTRFIRMFQ